MLSILSAENPELTNKKFSILQEISSAIVVTDNIGSIANLMLDLAISYTDAEKGSLMLINDCDDLYILAARGMADQFIRSYRLKIGEGIAGTVAKNRHPVLVEDIEKEKSFRGKGRDRYRTKSFISCPIISKNKLLGVLNINDKKDSTTFTNDEFELLKIVANHAAIALENAFLMNQLKIKASELEEINKKLIETDISKTEFLTRISHEFRTPLNSIKGATYYLQQTENIPRNEQKEFYDIITTETGNLVSIVENLFDFLRHEDETKIIKRTVLNIRDILREISESKSLKTMLARRNIRLKTDLQETLSDIVGDKIRIVQLFINLVEGLSHYLEKGDTITITAGENEFVKVDMVLSRKMPSNILPYLSQAKYVIESDYSDERLKLYLARRIAEVHRWEFSPKNTDNTFQISISIPKNIRQKVDAIIHTCMDLFVDLMSEVLDINICSIMMSDELTSELTIKSARGLDDDIIKRTRIRFGDSIAGWVALEGRPVLIEDVERDPRFERSNIPQYNTKSLLSLPLKVKDRVIGVINLNNKSTSKPFTRHDYYIASALSQRISHFIEQMDSGNYREEEFKHFITSLDSLLNAQKKYHKKKSLCPDLTVSVMDKLGASEDDKQSALYILVMYDLGLVLIDESILSKKDLLPSDMRTLKVHPYNTVSLLNKFEYSDSVKNAILHHHERFDGTGYPDGLKGEKIPLISRVLSVVDAYCAMMTERPYRKAFSKKETLDEIKKGSGSIFDPQVVNAFEEVIKLA